MSFKELCSAVWAVVVDTFTNNFARFSGRVGRREFWLFILFDFAVSVACGLLGQIFSVFTWVSGVYSLAALVPRLALTWRRLHDINKSGGNYFIGLIPLVGWIFVLVWLVRPGDQGENRFGPATQTY